MHTQGVCTLPGSPCLSHCSDKLTVGRGDISAHWWALHPCSCLVWEGSCKNQLNTAPLPQAASCWLRQKLFTQESLLGLSCNTAVLTSKCPQRWIFAHVPGPHVVQFVFCFVNRHAPKLSQKSWMSCHLKAFPAAASLVNRISWKAQWPPGLIWNPSTKQRPLLTLLDSGHDSQAEFGWLQSGTLIFVFLKNSGAWWISL